MFKAILRCLSSDLLLLNDDFGVFRLHLKDSASMKNPRRTVLLKVEVFYVGFYVEYIPSSCEEQEKKEKR